MAEENTDIKKGEPTKEPSGLSPVPIVPSPDKVAEAFASFEKEHEQHATISKTPPPPSKVDALQIKPPAPPAPVIAKPTPTPSVAPAPIAPTQIPPVKPIVPAPPAPAPTAPKISLPRVTPAPAIPTPIPPTQPAPAVVPHLAQTAPAPAIPPVPPTIPVTAPAPLKPPPTTPQFIPKKETAPSLVPPAQVSSAPLQPTTPTPSIKPATPQPPPTPAPIVQKQTAPIAPPIPPKPAPAIHTPTPVVPASFPIAPVSPVQKSATPIAPQATPPNPSASTKPQSVSTPAVATGQAPQTPAQGTPSTPAVKTKPVVPTMVETLRSQSSSPLHPLRTLRSDVEGTVKERKTSMVTIAAAEENRRASKVEVMPLNEPAPPRKKSTIFLLIFALVLLVVGGALLLFAFMPKKVVPIQGEPQLPASTLIFADETIPLALAGRSRTSVMNELVSMRESTKLSIGLIREIYPTKMSTSTNLSEREGIAPFLQLLAPHASDEFLRTLDQKYIFGVHVFDGNQAFLVVTTSSYEQTFVGMVEWEPNMLADLLPLFERRPRPRTPNERLSTTTAPSVINTGFTDMVIENQDARVLKDSDGNVILLWTFINQSTLAITTNERTLVELVSRIRNAPTLGL